MLKLAKSRLPVSLVCPFFKFPLLSYRIFVYAAHIGFVLVKTVTNAVDIDIFKHYIDKILKKQSLNIILLEFLYADNLLSDIQQKLVEHSPLLFLFSDFYR